MIHNVEESLKAFVHGVLRDFCEHLNQVLLYVQVGAVAGKKGLYCNWGTVCRLLKVSNVLSMRVYVFVWACCV